MELELSTLFTDNRYRDLLLNILKCMRPIDQLIMIKVFKISSDKFNFYQYFNEIVIRKLEKFIYDGKSVFNILSKFNCTIGGEFLLDCLLLENNTKTVVISLNSDSNFFKLKDIFDNLHYYVTEDYYGYKFDLNKVYEIKKQFSPYCMKLVEFQDKSCKSNDCFRCTFYPFNPEITFFHIKYKLFEDKYLLHIVNLNAISSKKAFISYPKSCRVDTWISSNKSRLVENIRTLKQNGFQLLMGNERKNKKIRISNGKGSFKKYKKKNISAFQWIQYISILQCNVSGFSGCSAVYTMDKNLSDYVYDEIKNPNLCHVIQNVFRNRCKEAIEKRKRLQLKSIINKNK